MKEIVKIIIKGASGYGPSDEAYEDQITIRPEAIAYRYRKADLKDATIKWRYRSSSDAYKDWYKFVCAETERQINSLFDEFCTDVGGVEITIVYADKTKKKRYYCVPTSYFTDYFRLIKQMVPSGEAIPYVLMTNEDYNADYSVELGKYRHFKGNEYEVIGMAKNSETEQNMVIYKALYGEGDTWVRPAAMWDETLYREGEVVNRFTKIED